MQNRNIVVLLCDQLRPDFLNSYGCTAVPTPNLDRLAAKGVVFENAITQSTVCAPARASMMTGRYVSDHMVWTNDVPFREGMETLAERMNKLGYTTGAFGKLHHYPAADGKGFSHLRQMEEGRLEDSEPYLKWIRKRHPEVTRLWNYADFTFSFPEDEYYEHWIASEAIEFIAESVEQKELPFLAWISFQGPHGPIDPPAEFKGLVDDTKLPKVIDWPPADRDSVPETVRYRSVLGTVPENQEANLAFRTAYAEMIAAIDGQIGRIVDCIEHLGIFENTSFIFSADHGDMLDDFGLQAKGPFPYPGQMNIPLVVSNHPEILAGSRSASLAGNIDIPGTVLNIAGDNRPIGYSRSLLELGRNPPFNPREVIFSEFCDSVKTVDDGRFRFSFYPFQGVSELYDRLEDPHCMNNLSANEDCQEVKSELLMHIIDFMTVAKGVRVEAHDFVPSEQSGLKKKFPDYQQYFPVAFPLSANDRIKLKAAGLNTDYNEFCREKDIIRYYAKPYWLDER